jgi:hypothetical protein
MAKVTLNTLATIRTESALTQLNENFELIAEAIENTLSLDGTSPNSMDDDLDLNSNRILNLPEPLDDSEPVRLQDLQDHTLNGVGNIATRDITISSSSPSGGDNGDIWLKVT